MTADARDFSTTYSYEPLQSRRHIRLLTVTSSEFKTDTNLVPVYSLDQAELPLDNPQLDFEAISDQLCINQGDNDEKAIQVGLMSEIYKKASRVIVWLGPEDEHSRLCKQWLEAIEKLVPTMQSANKITIGSPEYNPDWRLLILRDTFSSPDTDAIWAAAIGKFWNRRWFRRGWIVQEFLLAREVLCLTGDVQFSLQGLEDLFTVPSDDALSKATEGWLSYRILMQLKTDPFEDTPQPLRFLRVMGSVAQEFVTQELGDRLFGFLGMIEGLDFMPDYQKTVNENFTRFAATIARQYGSLDFLSMWSANLDALLKDTPEELLGLPSWVPSFSATPLTAPWRLAVGGARSWNSQITWNAAAGRRHMYDNTFDTANTNRLQVRGQIIDHIDKLSSVRILPSWDIEEGYLPSIVAQIKSDLPGFEHWTPVELIDFLNTVSSNGMKPRESATQLLGLAPGVFPDEWKHLHKHADSLGICLSMGRGRRFMRTEKGRAGLAPFIGSKARDGNKRGSVIVILHGCSVPIVLEKVDDSADDEGGEWKVIGDCYIEGVMHGEAVDWEEGSTTTFVLV
ncbi:Nn.00g056190.m01.CDS01 [Neocucurbitaria sp. VM-36]